MKDSRFGVVDSKGRTLVEPVYASVGYYEYLMLTGGRPRPTVKDALFQNGRLAFQDTSTMKWGYLDEKGNEVIPAQYSSVEAFTSNGHALVSLKGGRGIIDANGRVVFESDKLIRGYSDNGLAAYKGCRGQGFRRGPCSECRWCCCRPYKRLRLHPERCSPFR